jgi:hypothetical protein
MSKTEEMFDLIAQWQGSGLSRSSFAQKHGLSVQKLSYWHKKYTDRASLSVSQSGQSFIEIGSESLNGSDDRHPRMELELPGGILLRIY